MTPRASCLRRISALYAELAEHHAQLAEMEEGEDNSSHPPARGPRRVVPPPPVLVGREPNDLDRAAATRELERLGMRKTRKARG